METIVAQQGQNRWVCEENIVRFEGLLKVAANEMTRDRLRGLLARERERHRLLPPES